MVEYNKSLISTRFGEFTISSLEESNQKQIISFEKKPLYTPDLPGDIELYGLYSLDDEDVLVLISNQTEDIKFLIMSINLEHSIIITNTFGSGYDKPDIIRESSYLEINFPAREGYKSQTVLYKNRKIDIRDIHFSKK